MKKLAATFLFVCFFIMGYSQSDTLYTKKQQKIPCKIVEINDADIKYKRAENPDGPLYVVNKTTLMKYTLSTGYTEMIIPDELSLENEHLAIIKNRTVIKIQPFSVVNSQISVAYEKVIKVGMNLDIEAGYSNSSINSQPLGGNGYLGNTFNSGAYIKPGIKFFLGQDFSVKGLRYAHPLKGRYIKLDVALSFINFQKLQDYIYQPNQNSQLVTTNLNSFAYGGFVNYGRQFILGNLFTLEYYVGVGFTAQSNQFTNPAFSKLGYYDYSNTVTNYHGFLRTPGIGLSITGGFRIGYILPEKKAKTSTKPITK